jgi:pimeloyl-ACP methyl ester carboxylesterase
MFHPERFERLINCNAPHPWARLTPSVALETWRIWYAVVNAAPGLGRRAVASGWLPRWMLTHGNVGSPFSDDEVEIYLSRLREPARADATTQLYRYYVRVLREGARGGRWQDERIRAPTLMLFGERDLFITPKLVDPDAAARHADDIRIELVPDSGHFIVNEKPELVAERARGFLGEALAT